MSICIRGRIEILVIKIGKVGGGVGVEGGVGIRFGVCKMFVIFRWSMVKY